VPLCRDISRGAVTTALQMDTRLVSRLAASV